MSHKTISNAERKFISNTTQYPLFDSHIDNQAFQKGMEKIGAAFYSQEKNVDKTEQLNLAFAYAISGALETSEVASEAIESLYSYDWRDDFLMEGTASHLIDVIDNKKRHGLFIDNKFEKIIDKAAHSIERNKEPTDASLHEQLLINAHNARQVDLADKRVVDGIDTYPVADVVYHVEMDDFFNYHLSDLGASPGVAQVEQFLNNRSALFQPFSLGKKLKNEVSDDFDAVIENTHNFMKNLPVDGGYSSGWLAKNAIDSFAEDKNIFIDDFTNKKLTEYIGANLESILEKSKDHDAKWEHSSEESMGL